MKGQARSASRRETLAREQEHLGNRQGRSMGPEERGSVYGQGCSQPALPAAASPPGESEPFPSCWALGRFSVHGSRSGALLSGVLWLRHAVPPLCPLRAFGPEESI